VPNRRSSATGWLVASILIVVAVVVLAAALGGPGASPPSSSTPPPGAFTPAAGLTTTPAPSPSVACASTDQDAYVYHPARLAVLAACIRVEGLVDAVRLEADGDLHILVRLDPAFESVLRPANQGVELGDLVIEPVCVEPVTQADAVAVCADDRDPLALPYPVVGEAIWLEGRYVLDLEHGGWAELHPLYRWGLLTR
jgi:hypothetical protein